MNEHREQNEANELLSKILASTEEEHLKKLTKSINYFLQKETNMETIKILLETFKNQLELLRYDEFKDKETVDWKRVRAAIEHENTLVNHRLTWLLTSQALLFGGFGLIFQDQKKLNDHHYLAFLLIICFVGIVVSLKTYIDIEMAGRQLSELDRWWHKKYAPQECNIAGNYDFNTRKTAITRISLKHPPIQGRNQKNFWIDRALKMEIIFIISWVLISIFPIRKLVSALSHFKADKRSLEGWVVVVVLFILLIAVDKWRKNFYKAEG